MKPTDALVRLRDALPPALRRDFETIERIKSKFMPTPWQNDLAGAIDGLIANAVQRKSTDFPLESDNRVDIKGLAAIGPTRVGKSRAFRQYFDNHPVFAGYRDPASDSPLLWMSAPSPCNIVQLGRRILTATGYPLERELPAHRLFEIGRNRLNAMGKAFLYIEELQHGVHNVPVKEQEIVCDALKHLMESEKIVLFVSGIDTLLPFIALDSQLDERLVKFHFRKLTPEHQDLLADMVHVYAEAAGLGVAYSDADSLFARLSHASLDALGLAIETTIAAIAVCLRNEEKILTRGTFATVYAVKTGKAAPQNPFLAERWHDVACGTAPEAVHSDGPPPATQRGKSKA